jgi:hypothetical protein
MVYDTNPDHNAGTNTSSTGERGTGQGKEKKEAGPRDAGMFFFLNFTNNHLLVDYTYSHHTVAHKATPSTMMATDTI